MKKYLTWGGGALILLVLLTWNKLFPGNPPPTTYWKETSVACLPNGHQNLALHIHPTLQIFVDGTEEKIPAHIGDTPACMAEVHTHDDTGKIHAEAVVADKSFTLGDFFTVWGSSVNRDGFALVATAAGNPVADPAALILKDGEHIVLTYTRK